MVSLRFALPMLGAVSVLFSACSGSPPSQADSSEPITPGTAASSPDTGGIAPQSVSKTASAPAGPISCAADIGEAAAARLAEQCRAVSPATRPPCNVANSCAMIRNEVARGCAIIGEDAAKTEGCSLDPISREAAADMVMRYYSAINARDYASAYALWGPDGGTSGKTLTELSEGYAHTRRTHVDIGKVSDVEGGAGSIYVTVPVTVDAELDDGRRQRFTGSYALRQINRGMGISQGWHIENARLRPT